MLNTEFYDILDAELTQLVEENGFRPALKHKTVEQNKPYVLLVWFLRMYGQKYMYSRYITDGKGDNSCDIILDVNDVVHGKVYYVVQSKWNNKKNCAKQIDSKEFKATLDDFQLVLTGDKSETENEQFNEKYKELRQHITQNGLVRFVYFALCEPNPEVTDNIAAFEKTHSTTLEVLDINQIKLNYIDKHYKQIAPANPLEIKHSPDEKIRLNIEQLGIHNNFLKIDLLYESYIFVIRPKTIHDLFEKYRFRLFYKNVRNPLPDSNVNESIERTLQKEIPFFWYFNNGVTAITKGIVGNRVNPGAESIELLGLQVINGAQTAYSIYKSYKEASPTNRMVMDSQTLVTMRLLVISSDRDSHRITRHTNSQNPMQERDFWANDDIQNKLQQESFSTNYWYERRRGEFRELPEGVTAVSNRDLGIDHLAFNLENPTFAWEIFSEKKDYLFLSKEDDPKGIYEEIFSKQEPNLFQQMLAAYLFAETVHHNVHSEDKKVPKAGVLNNLPLAKILLIKYLEWKYEVNEINIFEYIIKNHVKEKVLFSKITRYTDYLVMFFSEIESFDEEDAGKYLSFMLVPGTFHNIKRKFQNLKMTEKIANQIENTELPNEELR